MKTILLPVSLPAEARNIARQAAWLAGRLGAGIIVVHVMEPADDTGLHLLDLDAALEAELAGVAVTRVLRAGRPAEEIAELADEVDACLIVMPAHGIFGAVTAQVLRATQRPVWTGSHIEGSKTGEENSRNGPESGPEKDFAVHRILCSIELDAHSLHTLKRAAEMATAFEATLSLIHVTPGFDKWGPGGTQVDAAWKDTILGIATRGLAKLQQQAGTDAAVAIESGNITERIKAVAARIDADVLAIGHIPGRSHLGDNGNGLGIIKASRIPVLSV